MNRNESPPGVWTKGYPPAMPVYYWWVDEVNYQPRPIKQVGFGFYMDIGSQGLQPIAELPADGFHMPIELPKEKPDFTAAKDSA